MSLRTGFIARGLMALGPLGVSFGLGKPGDEEVAGGEAALGGEVAGARRTRVVVTSREAPKANLYFPGAKKKGE